MDRHPLIWFRDGAAGRRPALLGTLLDVAQVVAYLQANDHDTVEVATLLDISRHLVHAASDYYGEFSAEIDAWLDAEANFARRVEVPDRGG